MVNAGIMTPSEFDEMTAKKEITVVEFSATWCNPCRLFAPVMEYVADKNKDKYFFIQVDIDSAEKVASKFNVDVVPTVIVLKLGKEVGRSEGFKESDEIEKFIENLAKAN